MMAVKLEKKLLRTIANRKMLGKDREFCLSLHPQLSIAFATIVWNYHIMKQKRIPLVGRQYLVPFILITSLFFLWGFAHAIRECT